MRSELEYVPCRHCVFQEPIAQRRLWCMLARHAGKQQRIHNLIRLGSRLATLNPGTVQRFRHGGHPSLQGLGLRGVTPKHPQTEGHRSRTLQAGVQGLQKAQAAWPGLASWSFQPPPVHPHGQGQHQAPPTRAPCAGCWERCLLSGGGLLERPQQQAPGLPAGQTCAAARLSCAGLPGSRKATACWVPAWQCRQPWL